jgi:hypothetical protein
MKYCQSNEPDMTTWTTANTKPLFDASVVEDVIVLEYMQQIDHGEYMHSSTYIGLRRYDVSSSGTEEQKEVYVNDRGGDMFKDMTESLTRTGHSHSCQILRKI